MSKIEFIEQLRRSLSSINDYTFVNDTIAYYENYIESQIRMGKTEEQVMQELGDPRLIAKSICTSHVTEEDTQNQSGYQSYDRASSQRGAHSILSWNGRQINMPSWLLKILTVLVVIVVFSLLFTILRWLSPFIMIGVLSYMIYKLFFGQRR